jgi:hypothetical protein
MIPKSMARGVLLLLTLCAVAGSTGLLDNLLGGHDISSGEEFEEQLVDHHRQLSGDSSICTTTELYYFEVTIHLVPDEATAGVCLLADQVLLGHDINLLLLDYGVGPAGADDDAIFVAGVCPEPITSSSTGRRGLGRWGGYVWKGGGGCRGCFGDNRDHRRTTTSRRDLRELGQVRGSSEKKWFSEQYAPWLETTLRNAIEQEIAPKHTDCLGNNPRQIEVVIEEISEKDLEFGCDDGTVIETLQSMSLTDEPLRDRNCNKCSSVDFSTYTSHGKIAEKGDYVSNEWKPEHGFTITASGGYNPESKARIFDTADQACVSSANGSLEFGSPNKNCENGGLGHGDGGKPGESGENCEPVGSKYDAQQSPNSTIYNVIIQHNSNLIASSLFNRRVDCSGI